MVANIHYVDVDSKQAILFTFTGQHTHHFTLSLMLNGTSTSTILSLFLFSMFSASPYVAVMMFEYTIL